MKLVKCCWQILRRLAQNREAAKKSRLRKKVSEFNIINQEYTYIYIYRRVEKATFLMSSYFAGLYTATREQQDKTDSA